jgi:hypothetical protein
MDSKDKIFQDICTLVENNDNVLGLFLSGSRGKKFENQFSDYDIRIIFKDDVNLDSTSLRYTKFVKKQVIDIAIFSFTQLRQYVEFGSDSAWDRYSFTHVDALIDKLGLVQPLISTKGTLPDDYRHDYIASYLDALINSCTKSLKCHLINDTLGAKLEACNGIPHLLNVIFGLEGRHAPFLSYLSRELTHYPLQAFPLSSNEPIELITHVVDTGSITAQQTLMRVVESLCLATGFYDVFEAWRDDWPWFLNYQPLMFYN